jgi:hypothetical protein
MVARKAPGVAARRNAVVGQRNLKAAKNPTIPKLPEDRDWSPRVLAWWKRAFSSPMSEEWVESDVDAMYMAADLMETFYDPYAKVDGRVRAMVQILKVLDSCGLTPMARMKLKWHVELAEEASAKTSARRASRASKPAVAAAPDPRDARRA